MRKLVILFLIFAMFSCRVVKQESSDRAYISNSTDHKSLSKDSVLIYRLDSVFVRQKGDSVFIDRWKYLYRDRYKERADTIVQSDTIFVERHIKETVQPTWIEKLKDNLIVLIIFLILLFFYKIK